MTILFNALSKFLSTLEDARRKAVQLYIYIYYVLTKTSMWSLNILDEAFHLDQLHRLLSYWPSTNKLFSSLYSCNGSRMIALAIAI